MLVQVNLGKNNQVKNTKTLQWIILKIYYETVKRVFLEIINTAGPCSLTIICD